MRFIDKNLRFKKKKYSRIRFESKKLRPKKLLIINILKKLVLANIDL